MLNPAVSEYIDKVAQPWQADVCNHLRQLIHQAIPDIDELIQYNKPHYKLHKQYICVFNTTKDRVTFIIFQAETLEAPAGFFEPGGAPERKTIKIREGQDVDYSLLTTLLQQAAQTLRV